MQVNSFNTSNQTSFSGKFSAKTLAKFQENLTPQEFKIVEKFRAGKRNTSIDIMTMSNAPVRMPNGSVVIPKETYAVITSPKSKAEGRIKLADGVLPFNMETFKAITKDLVKRGEELIEAFK